MEDEFKIYVDQLKNGRESLIHENLKPDFLDIHEDELTFEKPVQLEGRAYLAENELILDWNISTEASISCRICNQKCSVEIYLTHVYHSVPFSEIRGGIFNFKELLRESILLEVPSHVECDGQCSKRKEYAKYLKEPSSQKAKEEKPHRPFADFDWKQKGD